MTRLAIVLATSFATACGGVSDRTSAADGGVDAGADPAPADATGESSFAVHIFDTNAGLAGGTVCVVGQSDCEITDASGDTTVSVAGAPTDLELAFAATAAGHLSTVELGRIYAQLDVDVHTVPSRLGLLTDADATDLFMSAGIAYPATSTGFIRATVLDGIAGVEAGATVSVDGSSAAPVYLDDNGRPAPSLTAIGPGGGVLIGGVPAGPFSLTVHAANKACIVQSYAWDGSGSSAATGVVVAGALTDGITLACYDSQ